MSPTSPGLAPWAQEVIPGGAGFSRVAADDLLPLTLLSRVSGVTSRRGIAGLRPRLRPGLAYDDEAVDLRREQHLGADCKALNPRGLVPALQHEGRLLIQSPANIDWLAQRYPKPPPLPAKPDDWAHGRALAAIVGCDIHPVNNRRILEVLRKDFGADDAAITRRYATWIGNGFDAIEALLAADTQRGGFCFGRAPRLAAVYRQWRASRAASPAHLSRRCTPRRAQRCANSRASSRLT